MGNEVCCPESVRIVTDPWSCGIKSGGVLIFIIFLWVKQYSFRRVELSHDLGFDIGFGTGLVELES